MSADGRKLMDIGKRSLTIQPMRWQRVAVDDSVLGPYASTATRGLTFYQQLVQVAFKPEWCSGSQAVQVDAAGNKPVIPMRATPTSRRSA